MRNVLLAALLLLPLGGCGLPPALSIASMMMDAGSYATSGKSVTDHGISIVADRDCALFNIFSEGALCREERSYETAVAALQPLPGTAPGPAAEQAAAGAVPESAGRLAVEIAGAPFLADGLPRSGEALRPSPPAPAGSTFLAGGEPRALPPSGTPEG